ncbi:cysteine-rich receptor-like protein kinase 19 isoform X1 [Cryptomeria japonica]|uniref:cysteine-rich receptor-like protein kinase 19 isoform X1 n=1 Tax=Cryptomeria japonica TaxID=3369 RepID=UPI0027D9D97A|nr:cysteine-rich receptor-like protein kinase 19 isoform X1 [Cryptomeria japonica]
MKNKMKYNSLPLIPYVGLKFLPILLLLSAINFPSAICSDYVWYTCDDSSNFTDGSTYSTNLNLVINDLFHNAPQSLGFNTSSHGQSPNKVYGLLQCTGNISAERCSNCVLEANSSIHQRCPNKIGGRIWFDDCFLRYNNSNFFSILDTSGGGTIFSGVEINSDWEAFESTAISLLSTLSDKAYISANKGFSVGVANYSASEKLYGLVQCWRDISVQDCKTCLVTAREELKGCCYRKPGVQVPLGSCKVKYDTNPFFDSAESPSTSPEGSNPTTSTTSKKKSTKTLSIALAFVGGIILALVICFIAWRKRVRSAIFESPITVAIQNQERQEFSDESGLLMQEHQFAFSLKVLAEATGDFHDDNKLGEGGFGDVYKGTIKDGNEIAVKKLSTNSLQGKKEFLNEVKLVDNVQHRNLTKLLGCCAEGDERLLVYNYYPNKSLDTFIFDSKKRKELDWQKRYNIIIGIAHGLHYLHEDSQLRIIHRDIKATNILLDDKLNPKITDFGIARFFPEDVTQIQTRVAGTCGYMAPEYVMRGHLSVKVDVYSFGVLLLEIVCGRKNTDADLPYHMQNLLEWAWVLFKRGNGLNVVDSKASELVEEEALRCIHVGLLCVQADATFRPVMSDVIKMLTRSSMKLPSPTEPAFINYSESDASKPVSSFVVEYNEKETSQINETTVTELEAR